MKTKITKLLFFSALLFITVNSIVAKDRYVLMELTKIKINDTKIDSLLNKVMHDNYEILNTDNCFLCIEFIKAKNDTNYINIVVIEESKFEVSDFSILGFFETEKQIVLVIGEYFPNVELRCEKKVFSFKCKKNYKRDTIPPPPSMYNPPNYIFLYK